MKRGALCVWMLAAAVVPGLAEPLLEYAPAPGGPWTVETHPFLGERPDGSWGIGAATQEPARFYRVVDVDGGVGFCVTGIRAASRVRFVPQTLDSDGDTVPDCFDACPGHDDRLDADGDGLADGCDPEPEIPVDMALIPEGAFEMGDPFGTGRAEERPVHSVEVSAFFMDQHEVSWALWQEVRAWAVDHGYELGPGAGKESDHPVQMVNWYDAVKWCNARSERAGLMPVYRTAAGEVYRTRQVDLRDEDVLWEANGYRLPTEAEWEKGARGGLVGQQYPWGNQVDPTRANYSESGDPYETGPLPRTTPVGFYLPNGFGVRDMGGNVHEWCWDWYDEAWYGLPEAVQSDPRGPAGGMRRTVRGGSWFWTIYAVRCAIRGWDDPRYLNNRRGLRCVRSQTVGGSRAVEPALAIVEPGPGLGAGETPIVEYASAASGPWQEDPDALITAGADGSWEAIAGDGGARFFRLVTAGGVELPYCGLVLGPAARLEVIPGDRDTDADTVADCEDVCPGHEDRMDSDGDGVPDGCELCAGHDDRLDADGDGVPDGCEGERTLVLPGGVTLELVRIPAGSFQMGSPATERSRNSDEGPVHTVTIGYEFYIGKTEVTQGQWLAVMGSNPSYFIGDTGLPVEQVNWNHAKSFISALNSHISATGQGPLRVRLPSEAEWEYACRAGTQRRFSFGDSLSVADYCENGGMRSQYMWYCANNTPNSTKPVGTKRPNAFGLYDMHGNVWEWCEDWWHSSYSGAPTDGSAWVSPTASGRVVRGGFWGYYAWGCRSAARGIIAPTYRFSGIGLRLAAVQ